MSRSKLPYFFLGLAAALAVSALVLLLVRPGVDEAGPAAVTPPASVAAGESPASAPESPPAPVPEDPDALLKELGIGLASADPAELVNRIAKALEAGDFPALTTLIGSQALDPQSSERLRQLATGSLRLRTPDGIREVGEIELNARSRWALELAGQPAGQDRILLDLQRQAGKWSVEKISVPSAEAATIPKADTADSLGVADAFLRAVLNQDFEFARAFVDPATVTDAKIAGLCILFEEGEYRLRKSKPLRAMFQRKDTAGYLANVETPQGRQSAQFTLTLRRPPPPAGWQVSEINLDQLLAEYARRVAGGDVYYSPLVKNPAGGDTLALYFEFDEDEMNPRTRRQLEIVSHILRADPGKKITLSGHTDALGTEDYNHSLSARRAVAVKNFLIGAGVRAAQIVTIAKGASQPRRPNVTESGEDNPEGRRANRRTEIYLDF
jgi:outer membrane protein OmpA-like peptidoglycan-associated protein